MKPSDLTDFVLKVEEIAKIGLKYSKDPYARDNYQTLETLAAEFLSANYIEFNKPNFFFRDIYPTPNVSVRTILFSDDRRSVFLVEENGAKPGFSLPGGWCELGLTPTQSALKECREEAGCLVDIERLVGVTDRYLNLETTGVPEYILTFLGRIEKFIDKPCYEIKSAGFYPLEDLPTWSSKNDPQQMQRLLCAALDGETIFD